MLCLPGLTPVAKLDHAVGDSEGWVEPSREKTPSPASALRFGSLPSSMKRRASVGSMPSKPITKTRCFVLRSGLPPGGPDWQLELRNEARQAAATIAAEREPVRKLDGREKERREDGKIKCTCPVVKLD